MSLPLLFVFSPRTIRSCSVAVLMVALLGGTGCSHSRKSYRPIFARPAAVTAPCSTCGGSSTPSSGITTDESVGGPTTTVPSLNGPSVNSNVPTTSSSIRGSSAGSVQSQPSETRPSSKIGPEPEYDEIPSAATPTNKAKTTPGASAAKPVSTPELLPPSASNSPRSGKPDSPDARLITATATQGDRSNLSVDRLQPFVGGTSGRELFYPNKADRPWRYIVLHHSASASGNYDQIDREHRKVLGYDGCGYHFVIGNGAGSADGEIEVAQRWNNQKQGVHCRNARSNEMDEYGIGICLVGDLDQQPPTPRQVAATQALIGYLSQRYRIEAGHISTHAHLATTPTVCPGKYFPAQLSSSPSKEAANNGDVRATWNADGLLSMSH